MSARPWEITDLIWSFDGATRTPVAVTEVTMRLRERGQHRAAKLVERLPSRAGYLDSDEMDRLGLRVHRELQRLTEELQLGRRAEAALRPMVRQVYTATAAPVRIVDVGCGLGFVLRWLAAYGDLGAPVELVGVDLNPVLAGEAGRLATGESLPCQFLVGDALAADGVLSDGRRTLVISTGMLHHLTLDDVSVFFAAHQRHGVAGFAHWDIMPSPVASIGAWIFHRARMREPVSRHDGVMSARRAHPIEELAATAREVAPGYAVAAGPARLGRLDVLRPIQGVRR